MIKWQPFRYEGKVYDLTHLHPMHIQYVQPAKADKPERLYKVNVEFSSHCFTREIEGGESSAPGLLYPDSKKDSKETRAVDFERRYEPSKFLPSIIGKLNQNQKKCFHLERKGCFFTEVEIEQEGVCKKYEIYFKVSRASEKGILNLYVQSAYIRDETHQISKPRAKPISFYVILFNTLNNKDIKEPK